MNPIDKIVGKNLRDIRIKRGMSQETIGEVVGVSFQQIQKYERGTNRISASRLVELSKALEVELTELFLGVSEELPQGEQRGLAGIRREQKVVEGYAQMPPDVQKAVSMLVSSIVLHLSAKFTGGA